MLDIKVNVGRKFIKYDQSLFDVYVLDYGDNYHRGENEPSSEFEREVRKIKARYRDINKFYNAVALYNEYISYLEDKYGGHDLFKLKRKHGLIDDYIPPKPRIKNTKELKFLKKNKIIVGSVGRFLIDEEALDNYIDEYTKNMEVDNISVNKIKDKEAEKILDSEGSKNKYKHLKSQSFKDDVDYLESYFRNKNINNVFGKKKKGKKNKKKKNKEDRIMISDLMRSDYEDSFYGEDYMEDSDNKPMVLYDGLLLSSGTTKELDVYHKLNDLGWNSYKLMKKGEFSNRVASMFKPPKKKKKGKKNKKEGIYDGLLIDIMNDNGIDADDLDSFAEFQNEMLNMTSAFR